ncbi:FSH1-domain-containing protein [Terfezia boudieri ATCC MYA-4762]|uniref:FSH1-domain-containing protein n=1 Tax=Terfezia boudieri ATCC MYA-4762 TaxID=1051890 RepID=A0A3N4LFH2_9PEZI|nr:FSH1-domain-containing protein [Terfezia boudieri ATCC MYA-4762]
MTTRPIKILMLHGYTQSGTLFHAKTKALEKHLQKSLATLGGVQLVYPTGPIQLRIGDLPTWNSTTTTTPAPSEQSETASEEGGEYFAWWRKNEALETYTGLPSPCLDYLYDFISKQGPFDGVIGFSQGAAAGGILASLLEPVRRSPPGLPSDWPKPPESQPQLAFAVCYSGFRAPYKQYDFIYEPKIETPVMHFIGNLDTVVDEERNLALVRACRKEKVVYHPGGHYLPGGKMFLGAVTRFIVECVEARKQAEAGKKEEEESVEDMNVPF